jgi:flagellar M-ring protein FliF
MAAVDVDKLKEQGRRFASGFTTGQKTVTIAAVVGVFLAMFVFTKWAGKPQYAPLFTNLDSKATGEVTQALDSKGVSYQLTDGGSTVMVPKANLYKTRADLSTQGVPAASSDGWSIMDQGGITKSEFSQRVDYQRALQTESSKTISAIDGVEGATVTLTIPQQSTFAEDTSDQASAAVLVTPTSNDSLSSEKVQAIVNLVSSSVPALTPDKVTVADSLGNVLSAPGQDGNTSFKNQQQLEQKNGFEDDLAKKLEALIAASLGPGHAAVSVTADLDFNSEHTSTLTNQTPKGGKTPTTEKTSKETYTGSNPTTAGVLGPNANTGTATGGGNTNYSKQDAERQYAVDQVKSEIDKAPGGINSLSTAVLLDSSKVQPTDIAKWTQTLNAAAGFNKKRGDALSVNLVPFDTSAAKQAAAQAKSAESAKSQDFLLNLLRYVVTLAIVGAVLLLAWRSVKRAGVITGPVRVPLDLRELEAGDLVGHRADTSYDRAHALPQAQRPARPPIEAHSPVEHELTELIERQPDEVAQTLRSWLADRRT